MHARRRFSHKLGHSNPQHPIKRNVCAKLRRNGPNTLGGDRPPLCPGSPPRSPASDVFDSQQRRRFLRRLQTRDSTIFHDLLNTEQTLPTFPASIGHAGWVPTTLSGYLKWKYFGWPRRTDLRRGHFCRTSGLRNGPSPGAQRWGRHSNAPCNGRGAEGNARRFGPFLEAMRWLRLQRLRTGPTNDETAPATGEEAGAAF